MRTKVAKDGEVLKQLCALLPIEDWKRVQLEAAKQRIPMATWARNALEPVLKKLREKGTP